jgi:DNA-directed RNA polymerase subunit RPC12/RpoP
VNKILAPGVEIRCPHCGEWHAVGPSEVQSTPHATEMLYFTCKGRRFHAGHIDEWGHGYETRGAFKYTGLRCPKCRQPVADLESELAGTVVFACPCGHRWHGTPPGVVVT